MKLITFGEGIFRLTAEKGERLSKARELGFHLGGTELNVASNFASLGGTAAWLSVIPEGAAGQLMMDHLADSKIDTEGVRRASGNLGFYFYEEASAPRASTVPIRQKSLFADHVKGAFEWAQVFRGADIFHTSGITAGLGESAREELMKAFKTANHLGMMVSYDTNFRRNLWTQDEAKAAQSKLLSSIDILFCSPQDLQNSFSVSGDGPRKFMDDHQVKYLVSSSRSDDHTYGVEIWDSTGHAVSQTFKFESVDRIGVGDSMAAGFFWALKEKYDLQKMADFAAACGALKYSIRGDRADLKKYEVDELLKGRCSILR